MQGLPVFVNAHVLLFFPLFILALLYFSTAKPWQPPLSLPILSCAINLASSSCNSCKQIIPPHARNRPIPSLVSADWTRINAASLACNRQKAGTEDPYSYVELEATLEAAQGE
jgi:hypothetical protein